MMWWSLALAAEQVGPGCEPVRVRVLVQHLDEAQQAYGAASVVPGEVHLAAAREALDCLATPVPPELLGAYAWLEAEAAVWAHQVESAWPWIRLATDLRAPAPAHLGGRHPLQRWITDLPPAPPIGGPDARLERDGLRIVVDGQTLDPPRVRTATPHLIQVFDGRQLLDTWWQRGVQFRGAYLTSLTPVPTPERRGGDASYWQQWLVEHPGSRWVPFAQEQLDTLRLRDAIAQGGAGLESYLADDPGPGRSAAKVLLEPMDFDRAAVSGSRRALEAFITSHPGGRFVGDARRLLQAMDWDAAREQDTATAYDTYLERHPAGLFATEARRRLADRLVHKALHADDRQALLEVEQRYPWSIAGARAGARARETCLVAMVVAGAPNEDLVTSLREVGLRVDRRPRALFGSSEGLPAKTGLVFSAVEEAGGLYHGRAEIWVPGGRAPVDVWRVTATDTEAARALLASEAPSLEEWVGCSG